MRVYTLTRADCNGEEYHEETYFTKEQAIKDAERDWGFPINFEEADEWGRTWISKPSGDPDFPREEEIWTLSGTDVIGTHPPVWAAANCNFEEIDVIGIFETLQEAKDVCERDAPKNYDPATCTWEENYMEQHQARMDQGCWYSITKWEIGEYVYEKYVHVEIEK